MANIKIGKLLEEANETVPFNALKVGDIFQLENQFVGGFGNIVYLKINDATDASFFNLIDNFILTIQDFNNTLKCRVFVNASLSL